MIRFLSLYVFLSVLSINERDPLLFLARYYSWTTSIVTNSLPMKKFAKDHYSDFDNDNENSSNKFRNL